MKNEPARSCEKLPNIEEESQKNSTSSYLNGPVLESLCKTKRSRLCLKESRRDKENTSTPHPKLSSGLYKLAQSIEQSPISHLDIQTSSPVLNKLYEKIMFENGSFYEGEISSTGLMEGNGVLHYSSGKVAYSGSWFEGQFEGFGTLHN